MEKQFDSHRTGVGIPMGSPVIKKDNRRNHERKGSKYNPMHVQIKRLYKDAKLPTYAHVTDAGLDLYAHSMEYDNDGNLVYGTGVAVAIPEGYVGLVFPRSSIASKCLTLRNCVGVIDSGYRGEILAKFGTKHIQVTFMKWYDRLHNLFTGQVESPFRKNKGLTPMRMNNCWGNPDHRDIYKKGERIAQLIIMPYPKIAFDEVDELPQSDRGTGGHGSTGK